ncbi:collagen-like triple helix repeat-containing protein [Runella sp.]|uniref:collagen-like triple helix repeat-containing protein n=1 Tax=Runella sp. TaxID=1960881 RepID=UPI003D0C1BFC
MKIVSYFSFALLLIVSACAGPQGDTGPVGPQGPTGAKGDPGSSGTAFYSTNWVAVTKQSFITNYNKTEFYSTIGLQGGVIQTYLTQKTLDGGMVFLYNRVASNKAFVNAVPWDTYFNGAHVTYSFALEPGRISAFVSFSKDIDVSQFFADEEFRAVIIPPASGARFANVNWKDYNEVKKVLNLED